MKNKSIYLMWQASFMEPRATLWDDEEGHCLIKSWCKWTFCDPERFRAAIWLGDYPTRLSES